MSESKVQKAPLRERLFNPELNLEGVVLGALERILSSAFLVKDVGDARMANTVFVFTVLRLDDVVFPILTGSSMRGIREYLAGRKKILDEWPANGGGLDEVQAASRLFKLTNEVWAKLGLFKVRSYKLGGTGWLADEKLDYEQMNQEEMEKEQQDLEA